MKFYRTITIPLIFWIIIFLPGNVLSQENTLYFMHTNPQAIHTNPALFYRCRTYIELPVISSVRYAYSNTGFGYHDALHYGTGTQSDSIIIDIDNLDKKLKKRNYIRNDYSINLLGAGFRIRDYYFHFNISNHGETRVGIPGDIISLKDGNWDSSEEVPRDIDLGGLGVNAIDYIQIAVGVSKKIEEGFSIGLTAKYLMGAANLNTHRSELDIITQADPIVLDVSSRYRIYASFPVDITYSNLGIVETVNFDNSLDDPVGDFILNKNRGFAMDAGVLYDYLEEITLSASIIDLGLIRWRSNINRFESEGSITFRGFDLLQYATGTDETELFQALLDSIQDSWQFTNSNDPYISFMTPKIYLGGLYRLNEKIAFGALLRTEIFDRRPHFALTMSANFNPVSFFSGTVSYSIMNNKLYQLGLGFSLGGPGAQFFFVSDHIPVRFVREVNTGALFPYNARTVNFRFGINLIFACRALEGEGKPPAYRYARPRKLCPAYD
ncbi:MAG: hypothetical protein AMS27_04595 [Bacteroides sp. SM23_62_1]|nr:MAG: hypothetical protein AMS27_04595 [Bacteroides sp. SM23_62_1]